MYLPDSLCPCCIPKCSLQCRKNRSASASRPLPLRQQNTNGLVAGFPPSGRQQSRRFSVRRHRSHRRNSYAGTSGMPGSCHHIHSRGGKRHALHKAVAQTPLGRLSLAFHRWFHFSVRSDNPADLRTKSSGPSQSKLRYTAAKCANGGDCANN